MITRKPSIMFDTELLSNVNKIADDWAGFEIRNSTGMTNNRKFLCKEAL